MHSMDVFPLAMLIEWILNILIYTHKKPKNNSLGLCVCMCIIIIIMLEHHAMDLSLRFHIVTNVGCLNKNHDQTLSLE